MVGNLNNAHLNWDLSYTKNMKRYGRTKAIYISKVSNHINVNMDRNKEICFCRRQGMNIHSLIC